MSIRHYWTTITDGTQVKNVIVRTEQHSMILEDKTTWSDEDLTDSARADFEDLLSGGYLDEELDISGSWSIGVFQSCLKEIPPTVQVIEV